jgi:hypothetical protein
MGILNEIHKKRFLFIGDIFYNPDTAWSKHTVMKILKDGIEIDKVKIPENKEEEDDKILLMTKDQAHWQISCKLKSDLEKMRS